MGRAVVEVGGVVDVDVVVAEGVVEVPIGPVVEADGVVEPGAPVVRFGHCPSLSPWSR